MIKHPKLLCILACVIGLCRGGAEAQTNRFQYFTTWTGAPLDSYSSSVNTDGWSIYNAKLPSSGYQYVSEPYAAWLMFGAPSATMWIKSPLFTNGAGQVTFYCRSSCNAPAQIFVVEWSTNGGAFFQPYTYFTNQNDLAWTACSTYIGLYTNTYVRIRKTDDQDDFSQELGIDDIWVNFPLSYMFFTNVTITPVQPVTDQPTTISATIEPRAFASNVQAVTLFFSTNNWATTNTVSMVSTGNNLYTMGTNVIPSVSRPGTFVPYYITVGFDGITTNNMVNYFPTNWPASTTGFMVRARAFNSIYTNMNAVGPPSTNMQLVADNRWEGSTVTGLFVNPVFYFQSGSTNWGDTNFASSTLPIQGGAETSSTITVGETVTNHLLFTFNETNQQYSIQTCHYVNFDGWSGASTFNSYSNNEAWLMVNARTTTNGVETNKTYSGKGMSAVLLGNTNGCIISSYLSNGIGAVKFRYRNWLDNGATGTSFRIDKGMTTNSWTTVTEEKPVWTPDYVYYSLNMPDSSNHYVRIVNTGTNIYLCLDEIVVTRAVAVVKLANPQRSPAGMVTNGLPVSVSIDFSTIGGATNLRPRVYWISPDATEYSWRNMTVSYTSATNGTIGGAIPPAIAGAVSYYFTCDYDGFNAGTVYYPDLWATAPLGYTNGSALLSYRSQNFDAWTGPPAAPINPPGYTDSTNPDGWSIHNAILPGSGYPVVSSNYAAWLMMGAPSSDMWIKSPLLTNGAGQTMFSCRSSCAGPPQIFVVETSTNGGASYQVSAYYTNQNNLAWTSISVDVDKHTNAYVRIRKTDDQDDFSQELGIDNILITPPSANVTITNVLTSPGYPGTSDPFRVTCDMASVDTNYFLAYNWRPYLCYRVASGTWYYADMLLTTPESFSVLRTNNYYGTIPRQITEQVDWYIRCDFAGYYYTNGSVSTMRSPALSPILSYTPRRYLSDYSVLVATSEVQSVNMILAGDYMWQGIFDSVTTTNQINIKLQGLGHYLSPGNFQTSTDSWGDAEQVTFDTPVTGIATQNGLKIVLNVNTQSHSQIMVRFNTADGYYEMRRCAYQDFNTWIVPSTSQVYRSSLNFTNELVFTNDFNSLPTDAVYIARSGVDLEDYEGYDPSFMNVYFTTNSQPMGHAGWYINNGVARYELGNRSARLSNPSYSLGNVFAHASTRTEGLKDFTFEARARMEDSYIAWYTNAMTRTNYQVSAILYSTNFAYVGSPSKGVSAFVSLIGRYLNSSNFYECRWQQTNLTECAMSVWRCNNGTKTVLKQEAKYTRSLITPAQIVFALATSANAVEISANVFNTNGGRLVEWTSFDDSVNRITTPGNFGVWSDDADLLVTNVATTDAEVFTAARWQRGVSGNNIATNCGWTMQWAWDDNDYIGLTNGTTNAWVMTPRMTNPITWVEFRLDRVSGTPTIAVEGSADGVSSFTVIRAYTNISGGTDHVIITNNISPTYQYIRWRMVGDTNTKGRVEDFWISCTNSYSESFTNGYATNWYLPSGWAVVSNKLRRPGYLGPNIPVQLDWATNDFNPYPPYENDWAPYATYWVSNCNARTISTTFQYWDKTFLRIRQTNYNYASLILDNLTMTSWKATNYHLAATGGWDIAQGWITTQNDNRTNWVAFWQSKANPAYYMGSPPSYFPSNLYVKTPLISNGVGWVSFKAWAPVPPATCVVEWADNIVTDSFTPIQTFVMTDSQAADCSVDLYTNAPRYVRIRFDMPGSNTVLCIDDVKVSEYRPRDDRTWEAYNALISAMQYGKEFETNADHQTCFLNSNGVSDVLKISTNTLPFVQSARLVEGIGEVSFWYRNWQTNGLPAAKIQIFCSNSETNGTNWMCLDTIDNITDTKYRFYKKDNYELSKYYVRICCATTPPASRVGIDNVTVAEPLAANFTITNITTVPAIPLYANSVQVFADFTRFVMKPSNITARLYYHYGTSDWGNVSGSWQSTQYFDMVEITNTPILKTLRSSGSIPPQNIDSVVQYQVVCTFTGTYSQFTSPKTGACFSNPKWYYPVDLNAGQSFTNPYYFSFSCLPSNVWINEINYRIAAGEETNEYVELCGPAGTIISNWQIQLIGVDTQMYDYGVVTNNQVLSNDTGNGWGFLVYGDTNIPSVDITFTNASSQNIRQAGGVRLVRKIGAWEVWEQRICYGPTGLTALVSAGYENIGYKDMFRTSALYLDGTGNCYTNFHWTNNTDIFENWYFPGTTNANQTLLTLNQPPNVVVAITAIWRTTTNTWLVMTSTATNDIKPDPWYATNLLPTITWFAVTNAVTNAYYSYNAGSGTYTQWFANLTNATPIFYRIRGTN